MILDYFRFSVMLFNMFCLFGERCSLSFNSTSTYTNVQDKTFIRPGIRWLKGRSFIRVVLLKCFINEL